MKKLELVNGLTIPALGFGTWQLEGQNAFDSVKQALEIGYRHIDTADRYGNHQQVGQAILDSGLNRDEIFLTTKVWHSELSKENLVKSAERFLEELNTPYLDLLLIHWPNRQINVHESLDGMKILLEKGLIKSAGVSNFTIAHLEQALHHGVEIVNNQVEFHPSLNQKALKDYCDAHEIVLTAYSPIAQGQDLELSVIKNLASKYQKTESQIILNWLISKGIVAIPRSSNPARIKENFESQNFEILAEDIEKIDSLGQNNRIVNPPFAEFD